MDSANKEFDIDYFVKTTGIDRNDAIKYLQTEEVTFNFLKKDLACGIDMFPNDYIDCLYEALASIEKDVKEQRLTMNEAVCRSNLYSKAIKQFVNGGIPVEQLKEIITSYKAENGIFIKPHALRMCYLALKQEDEDREEELVQSIVGLTEKARNVLDDVDESLNKQNNLIEETTTIIKEKEELLAEQLKEIETLSFKIEELENAKNESDEQSEQLEQLAMHTNELIQAKELLEKKERENEALAKTILELKNKVDTISQNNDITTKLNEIVENQRRIFEEKEREQVKETTKKSAFSNFVDGFKKKEVKPEVKTKNDETKEFISLVISKKYSPERLDIVEKAVKAGVPIEAIKELIDGEPKPPWDDANFKFAMNHLINQLSKNTSGNEGLND